MTDSNGPTTSALAGTIANSTGSSTFVTHSPCESYSVHRVFSTNTVLGTNESTSGEAATTMPSAAKGIAHQRCRPLGALPSPLGSGTISTCVNITEVTTAAGWIAGLAIVALIAAGWRKPARATADPARARRPLSATSGLEVAEVKAPPAVRTRWWRRLWSVVASSVLAVWVGAIAATVIAFGTAWIIITLTDMLKQ